MNALDLLKRDHDQVKDLFRQIDQTQDAKRLQQLFTELRHALETHARIEEEVFYPSLAKVPATRDLVQESYEDHDRVKTLLNELSRLNPGSAQWLGRLTELREDVDQHVRDEEGELFPKARQACGQQQLDAMGQQMEQIKTRA